MAIFRTAALCVCGLGGAGAYVMSAPGSTSVVRVVDKSPGATFAAYDAALKPLSIMPPRAIGGGEYEGAKMSFRYTADPGREIDLTAMLNGKDFFDLRFTFAPSDADSRTNMTVTMTPTRSAPEGFRTAFSRNMTGPLNKLVDDTAFRVEMGLPIDAFPGVETRSEQASYGEPRATTNARPASDPAALVRQRQYEQQRAMEQAAAPAMDVQASY